MRERRIPVIPVIATGRYVTKNELVEGMVIHVPHTDERLHQDTAANVHTYNIGNNLVAKIAGKADYTACSGMYIGHDADFTLAEHIDGQ